MGGEHGGRNFPHALIYDGNEVSCVTQRNGGIKEFSRVHALGQLTRVFLSPWDSRQVILAPMVYRQLHVSFVKGCHERFDGGFEYRHLALVVGT